MPATNTRHATRLACAAAVSVLAASCGSAPPPPAASAPPAVVPQAPPQAPERVAQAPQVPPAPRTSASRKGATSDAPDRRGRFIVQRLPASDPRHVKTRDSGFLEEIVRDMTRAFDPKLPVDVPVSFAELGQANAFYSPEKKRIVVGYELIDQVTLLFLKNVDPNERDTREVVAKVAQQVVDTISFVFYHEAAHAIIDLDRLPITGREEDAADQLATVMTVASAKSKSRGELKPNGLTRAAQGGDAAINGALFFLLSSQGEGHDVSNLPFWDEHSLSQQRFYNILTWVYGSDPQKYAYLVERGALPESRARRGPREFTRMVQAWVKILEDARAA